MAFSSNKGSRREGFSEINITPLTDVFLVLLVIMFLIAPLLDNKAALKVEPPSAKSASNSKDRDPVPPILIEVDQEGSIAINSQVVVEAEAPTTMEINDLLYKQLLEITGGVADSSGAPAGDLVDSQGDDLNKPKVKLKADDGAKYGRVVAVYDAVNRAKIQGRVGQLVLVTTIQEQKE